MITSQDKIIKFSSIGELKAAILQDVASGDVNSQRYCVRFIMLNDFATFRELTAILAKELKVERFELQNLAYGVDKTITVDMLSDAIKGIEVTSLVTPFSELVRFYKEADFNGFFNEVILTEDLRNPHKRIYIPIIGLHNRFNDFLKSFGRIEESAPIWQLYSPNDDKVKVFVTKFKLPKLPDKSEYCVLPTMRSWLDFWRKEAPRDKILCSALPIRAGWRNSRPDSIFCFAEITNPYEFITEFLGVNVPFEYREEENRYWERIQEAVSENDVEAFSWKKYVEVYFNTIKFELKKILDIWADERSSDYDRWLLKNYLLCTDQLKDKPYLKLCLTETGDYVVPAALFVKIAERIFYYSLPAEIDRHHKERYALMRKERRLFRELVPISNQEWIKEQIIAKAQKDKGFPIVKKMTTDTFNFEKELYFGWYQLRSDEEFGLRHLKEFYPDLYAYLSASDNSVYRQGAEWVAEYFKAYREAKVKDAYTPEVRTFIDTYNADDSQFWDWYYKHDTCHSLFHNLVNDEGNKPDKVYWIDGLGAEFIPFIMHVINESKTNYEVVEARVATSELPSNTSLNRFKVDNEFIIKLGELDELAHRGHYRSRTTLIAELSIVRKSIEKILRDNSVGNHTIAIVSDHGLSALSRLCEPRRLSGDSHHEGRYIPNDVQFAADDAAREYVRVNNLQDNTNYKVALTHASLGKKPSHEVHGGCTPEEVLVPFIVMTNNDASKPVKYNIEVITKDVPLSAPVFRCVIMPKPFSAQLIVGNHKTGMSDDNTEWWANIPSPKEGKVEVSVLPYKGRSQRFDINVYGFGMNNALIDDDF